MPAATIKYYVREGLLPGGERTGYNQVEYDESHLQRLRLLRALIGLGGIPVAAVDQVVAAVEDADRTVHSTLGEAQRAVSATSVDEVLRVAENRDGSSRTCSTPTARGRTPRGAGTEWLERAGDDLDALSERAVVGTVLGDALLTAARREAQKQASATHFGTT